MLFVVTASHGANVSFMNTYGGLRYDNGASCKTTADGGIIMAGSTGSFGLGDADMYMVKTNSAGVYQWSQSYGGLFTENCNAIIETADTGFMLVGYTNSYGAGQFDMFVVKTDSLGDTLWTRALGGAGWDFAYDVIQSVDGNYIVVGETYSTAGGDNDVFIVKLDVNGNTLWTKSYGGVNQDFGRAIVELSDSMLVIAGGTSSLGSGGLDVLLLKLSAQGDSLWARAHGGADDDWARDVIITNDNSISALGVTWSFSTDFVEMYHIKTDNSGTTLIFQANWGQINNQEGFQLLQRQNGNYQLFGYTMTSGGGAKDFILQEVNSGGGFISGKTYGGNLDDIGHSMARTSDNGLILFGTTNGFGVGLDDYLLVKTDSVGNDSIGNPMLSNSIIQYEDTAIAEAPVSIFSPEVAESTIKVYPVPITTNAVIDLSGLVTFGEELSFELINGMGQVVKRQVLRESTFTFSREGIDDGIYTYLILHQTGNSMKRYTGNLVIISK